jgi:small subunit ribosomal protein S16
MATVIRLTRMGRKKSPFYRIVVTDSRKKRDGGWIESIGTYNPLTNAVTVDEDRLDYWMGVGAKISERVGKLTEKKPKNFFSENTENPKKETVEENTLNT